MKKLKINLKTSIKFEVKLESSQNCMYIYCRYILFLFFDQRAGISSKIVIIFVIFQLTFIQNSDSRHFRDIET